MIVVLLLLLQERIETKDSHSQSRKVLDVPRRFLEPA
jgi:hypothetical protein